MLLFAVTHIWQSMQSEISHQDFHRSLTAEYSEAVPKKEFSFLSQAAKAYFYKLPLYANVQRKI